MKTFIRIKSDVMAPHKYLKFPYLATLLFLFVLSSCGTRQKHSLFSPDNEIDLATLKDIYVVNDQGRSEPYYRIKEGDVISIRNLQNLYWGGNSASANSGSSGSQTNTAATNSIDPNAVSFIVDNLGMVTLPSLPDKVKITGLTRTEARQKIEDLYVTTGKLVNPIIELNVVNLKVNLIGEFVNPGSKALTKDNTTLIDILSEAGGITKSADPRSLKIQRGRETIYVNLTSDRVIGNNKLIMQNNDLITIGKNKSELDSEKINRFNTVVQPILVVVNLVILVFTLTK